MLATKHAKTIVVKEVMIFYTNESAPLEEEVDKIHLVTSFIKPFAEMQPVIDRFENDSRKFQEASDKELSQLKEQCALNLSSFIHFSNRMTRQVESEKSMALYCFKGDKELRELDFSGEFKTLLDNTQDLRERSEYKSSPLSHPAVLDLVLKVIGSKFDSQKFAFIWQGMSHGSDTHAFVPQFALDEQTITSNTELVIKTLREARAKYVLGPSLELDSSIME